jgi:2-polyprenyl-3-methyl-5-hydroxy-6-metoxy-1,4-benzoquinol methylase
MKCPLCDSPEAHLFAAYPRFAVQECASCRFRFVDLTAADYPADAQWIYDDPIGSVRPCQPHLLRRVRDILRYRRPPSTTLDIGCGKGELPLLLSEYGFEATGLEVKQNIIDHLRHHHPGPRWLSCGVDQLVAQGQRFDVISLYHVLEHVAEPVEFLEKVNRLCAPGALIVIEVPNVAGLHARLKGRRWHYYKVDHVGYFSARHLIAVAERLGWRVLDVKGYQHFSHPQGVWWKDCVKSGLAYLGFQDVVSLFAYARA